MITIEYISHACLLIDLGEVKLLTDPWFAGPAYKGHWFVFPKPVDTAVTQQATHILYSHGHEDHLHIPSLETLPKSATVFYPFSWQESAKPFFHELGFTSVTEALSNRTYRLGKDTTLTYIANNLDNVMVIEHEGKVLLNLNDALHSFPDSIIQLYVREIQKKWPTIYILFSSYAAANYFPNNIKVADKNDYEVACVREQSLAHNFCKIVNLLQPGIAIPFASDFVLLHHHLQWVNETRFSREKLAEYYKTHFENITHSRILAMYPHDVLQEGQLLKQSPYWELFKTKPLTQIIREQYQNEIQQVNQLPSPIGDLEAEELQALITKNIQRRLDLVKDHQFDQLKYSLEITDLVGDNFFTIRFFDKQPIVERREKSLDDGILLIRVSSPVLTYSLSNTWGGDAILIGYGAEMYIHDKTCLDKGLDLLAMQLLVNYPRGMSEIKKHPLRGMIYFMTNSVNTKLMVDKFISKKLGKKPTDKVIPSHTWLSRSKCEICQICDIPLLDNEFIESSRYLQQQVK